MNASQLKFGIPDISLVRSGGAIVNPSSFAGHVLVVVFCPPELESEAAELAQYRQLSPGLSAYDGWLLMVSERALDDSGPPAGAACVHDQQGSAWAEFQKIVPPEIDLNRSEGATYLFSRGGSLERVWPGVGHACDVSEELARPCFGL